MVAFGRGESMAAGAERRMSRGWLVITTIVVGITLALLANTILVDRKTRPAARDGGWLIDTDVVQATSKTRVAPFSRLSQL
jgi:hypothetical protein